MLEDKREFVYVLDMALTVIISRLPRDESLYFAQGLLNFWDAIQYNSQPLSGLIYFIIAKLKSEIEHQPQL